MGMKLLHVAILSLLPILVYVHPSQGNQIFLDFERFAPSNCRAVCTPDPFSVLGNRESDGVLFGKSGKSTGVAVVESVNNSPSSGTKTVAGLDENGQIPGASIGDIYWSFVVPGTNNPATTNFVAFSLGDSGQDLDTFTIRLFDLNDSLLELWEGSSIARFFVSFAQPGIYRVEIDFDDSVSDFGYTMDDLSFAIPTAVVPEPGSFLLWGVGLLSFPLAHQKLGKKAKLSC
jgi:hypothetical protein